MNDIKFEIDFLPVESGEKSGDAIALRYGDESQLFIHVVDGGTLQSGQDLVDHINSHYGNPAYIDHVVCTHNDSDHASGLRTIIDNFAVGTIWMNRPWLYAAELVDSFKGNWSVDGLRQQLRSSYPKIAEIEDMAEDKGIRIREAFQGQQIGPFLIASPSREYYLSLVPNFTCTPTPAPALDEGSGVLRFLTDAAKNIASLVAETWHTEYLPGGETSASNESSIVQYAHMGGKKILLTGDAGIEALGQAADYLESRGFALGNFQFFQIPHHGSRRNVSTDILNRFLGRPLAYESDGVGSAYVSASKKDPDHPRRRVVNAFKRRGYNVVSTEGAIKGYRHNFPMRAGWSPATSLPFYYEVEEAS